MARPRPLDHSVADCRRCAFKAHATTPDAARDGLIEHMAYHDHLDAGTPA